MVTDSRTKYPEINRIRQKLKKEQERDDNLSQRKQQSASDSVSKGAPLKINKTDFYKSREWQELRWKAIKASDGCCVYCGRSRTSHGIVIHVDHIKPRFSHPNISLVLNNLQVTCEDCNLGKGIKDA